MARVVPAEGALLHSLLDATALVHPAGLRRPAFGRLDAAQARTPWGAAHRRHFAVVEGTEWRAGATQYRLPVVLDGHPQLAGGIGGLVAASPVGVDDARFLVEKLLEEAAQDGAALALALGVRDVTWWEGQGFERIPTTEVELEVAPPPRHGAPMTLVRAGDERDLPALVAIGRSRAAPFRFHLDRDADLVHYAITTRRLLCGLGPPGARELQFFVAEEGIAAVAYVVLSVAGGQWTIEECGDRDLSGARVGAILQALIARDPGASPPSLRAWLPPGFVPPQITVRSSRASTEVVMVRSLRAGAKPPGLTDGDVLYWHADVF